MNSSHRLDISPSADDLLGIASVSGFYGPGAWSIWAITLFISWRELQAVDNSKFFYHISHLLYTNWAAVDLCWRLAEFNTENDNKVSGRLAAAYTITFCGMQQTCFQFIWLNASDDRKPLAKVVQIRSAMLIIGVLIPFVASCLFTRRFPVWSSYDNCSGLANIPVLYYPTVDWPTCHCVWTGLLLVPTQINIGLGLVLTVVALYNNFTKGSFWELPTWIFCVVRSSTFGAITPLWLLEFVVVDQYMTYVLVTGGMIVRDSCFFMPCAPQSITEMDQAFILFAGLIMLVYETHPVTRQSLARAARGMVAFVKKRTRSRGAPLLGEDA